MLMIGAALTTFGLQMLGKSPLGGESSYLASGVLIAYWTTLTIPSLFITAAAAIGGALLIATNRSILTAGVMICLITYSGSQYYWDGTGFRRRVIGRKRYAPVGNRSWIGHGVFR